MAMMMPTTEDFNRSLRVRCISGRINGGPGIPLNFDGCHFKDQYEDKLFKKYDSVRLNFYDQPSMLHISVDIRIAILTNSQLAMTSF